MGSSFERPEVGLEMDDFAVDGAARVEVRFES